MRHEFGHAAETLPTWAIDRRAGCRTTLGITAWTPRRHVVASRQLKCSPAANLKSRSGVYTIRILAGLEKDDFWLCVRNALYEYKCGKRIYLVFWGISRMQGLGSGQGYVSKFCETSHRDPLLLYHPWGHVHSALFQQAGSLDVTSVINFPF